MILGRGVRPYRVEVPELTARTRGVDRVPGVAVQPDAVWCARDAVEVVCELLGVEVPADLGDAITVADLPGLDRYYARTHARLRPYQPEAALFLASGSGRLLVDPPRAGKCAEALAACELIGAGQVLVLGLAVGKWTWLEQIAMWTGEAALMLEGRGADEGRWFCTACLGRGSTAEGRCGACRGRGSIIVRGAALEEALTRARFVVANYDILVWQSHADALGRDLGARPDLPGWVGRLRRRAWSVVILDESHLIGLKGLRRRCVDYLTPRDVRVWALTGTPDDGRLSRLWAQLDLVSGHTWGRTSTTYEARYCEGYRGEYGWVVPKGGRSPLAETELRTRLRHVMLRRERSEIVPHMPPKTRQVVRLEASSERAAERTQHASGGDAMASIARGLAATAAIKVPHVVEAVLAELEAGLKVVVYARLRETARKVHEALAAAIAGRAGVAARSMGAVTYSAVDTTPDARHAMARAYREHSGAAALVSTIDAMQVAISLLGTASVHYVDLHWDPTALIQSEDRGYEPTITRGLAIVYYVVRGSVDEHVEATVLPKLEALERAFGDTAAADVRSAFTERETLDEVWSRLTAHLREATC